MGNTYAGNTVEALVGSEYSSMITDKSNSNDGRPDFECTLELRICNGYGYDVTDVIQLSMEQWALDFCNDYDGFCSELMFKDGYVGGTGFNRVFSIKLNVPEEYDTLVKSFDDNIPKWIIKARKQFNVKGFAVKELAHTTKSCDPFDNEWKEIPKGVKKIIMAIAAGNITPEEARKQMEFEIGQKMQKKLRKKIEKKLDKKFKKMIRKQIARIAIRVGAKAAGKSLAKKVPGVGAVVGFAYGIYEISQGNYEEACLEVSSGLASTVPGVGTALSVALDAAGASKEIIEACLEWNDLQNYVDNGFKESEEKKE